MEASRQGRVGPVYNHIPSGYERLLYLLWSRVLGTCGDLEQLAQNFWPNDEEKALKNLRFIRGEIQRSIFEVFGFNPFALNSSFHFIPGDTYEALLAARIAQLVFNAGSSMSSEKGDTLTSSGWFSYGVYYQRLHDEQPYLLKPCFPLHELLNIEVRGQTSWDFHVDLMRKLQSPIWQEELRERFCQVVNLQFLSDDNKKIVQDRICDVIISVLQDYRAFFGNFSLKLILECNLRLLKVCQENFDFLSPIFQKVGFTKQKLDSLAEEFAAASNTDFHDFTYNSCQQSLPAMPFQLVCLTYFILGGLQHIGSEYGKYNRLREELGLQILSEPTNEHRFHFVSCDGRGLYDLGFFVELLAGETSEIIKAAASGGGDTVFCPIKPNAVRQIRAADFFIKADKKGLFFQLERVVLTKNDFILLMQILDLLHPAQVKVLTDTEQTLGDWLAKLENPKLLETFRVRSFTLLLCSYVEDLFHKISRLLSSSLYDQLSKIFLEYTVIERIEIKPKEQVDTAGENSGAYFQFGEDPAVSPKTTFFGIRPVFDLPRSYAEGDIALQKIAIIALLQEFVARDSEYFDMFSPQSDELIGEVVRLMKKPE